MGASFAENVYRRKPKESYQRILEHIKMLLPHAEEAAIQSFLN